MRVRTRIPIFASYQASLRGYLSASDSFRRFSFSPIPIHYGVSSPRGDIELPVLVLIRPDRSIAFVQLGAADPGQLDQRIGVFLDQEQAGDPRSGPAPPGP